MQRRFATSSERLAARESGHQPRDRDDNRDDTEDGHFDLAVQSLEYLRHVSFRVYVGVTLCHGLRLRHQVAGLKVRLVSSTR